MTVNRGKEFEQVIKDAFLKVPDVSVVRLPDPTQGYLGIRNISDFIVYKYPYQYFIECKSVHGNTLPFSNISDNQWQGMLEMSKIKGVVAGVMCWWIDKDITRFIPIETLEILKQTGVIKSVKYDCVVETPKIASDFTFKPFEEFDTIVTLEGHKKRVFFDYDMDLFFHAIEKRRR